MSIEFVPSRHSKKFVFSNCNQHIEIEHTYIIDTNFCVKILKIKNILTEVEPNLENSGSEVLFYLKLFFMS